ncbi:hypothetical protein BC938DRAFT_474642 [Jimgerdemannia flammicorona]|uniref:TLC domain-containing protein n=1 Tax=Jimgerdemannia flammicorona TaxID=994334 RepID=A0A433Q1X6_9FUNG|nr:hypothetical protein BC938DRAFT_474642 [Jimgerdemannia flammicorona]
MVFTDLLFLWTLFGAGRYHNILPDTFLHAIIIPSSLYLNCNMYRMFISNAIRQIVLRDEATQQKKIKIK